jgi:hypothetical protein
MNYLFLVNTPAHVHTYKNVVPRLDARGHETLVLAREYACTVDLCEAYELPYVVYGSHDTGRYSRLEFAKELPSHLVTILHETVRFSPDVVFGRGPYAAWAGSIGGGATILLLDSEPGELAHRLSARLADIVLTPAAFRDSLGDCHYTFEGLKECAYLHPETFDPDTSVREELGVDRDEPYVIVRFNAFDAFHDVDECGLSRSRQRALVERLSETATVFVSHEGDDVAFAETSAREYDLGAARMHDALAEASLLVAETGTMVTEAALLGTPAIGCGAFADWEFGEFAMLEDAGLIVVTRTFEETVDTAVDILEDRNAETNWLRRRDEFIDDQVDLTDLLVEVALNPMRVSTADRIRSHGSPT